MAAHGKLPNWEFMAFIEFMLSEFAKTKGGAHTPLSPFGMNDNLHNEFTLYIEENSKQWEPRPMTLKQHIKANHDNNLAQFALWLSERTHKTIRYQQVQRWVKLDCIWHDGRVWAPKT